jgi:hypothetical protein
MMCLQCAFVFWVPHHRHAWTWKWRQFPSLFLSLQWNLATCTSFQQGVYNINKRNHDNHKAFCHKQNLCICPSCSRKQLSNTHNRLPTTIESTNGVHPPRRQHCNSKLHCKSKDGVESSKANKQERKNLTMMEKRVWVGRDRKYLKQSRRWTLVANGWKWFPKNNGAKFLKNLMEGDLK